jgi:hypothetical protein
MYFKFGWTNTTHARDDTKCISTLIYQSSPMPARTKNRSQHVMTKPITCHREHKMHLNMRWPKLSHVSEGKKIISTRVDLTHPLPARTQNASQHELTKQITSQQGHKIYGNMCLPNSSHDRKDSKYSTCVDQTPLKPASSENAAQHVLTNSVPSQRWHKMYLNLCWTNTSHACENIKCILTYFNKTPHMQART